MITAVSDYTFVLNIKMLNTLKKRWSRIHLEKILGNYFHSEKDSSFSKSLNIIIIEISKLLGNSH